MQYRIEVYRQGKDDYMPQSIHKGDIIRSKDIAETVMEKFKDDEKIMIDYGHSVFAKVKLMQRNGYLYQWNPQSTITYDKMDEKKERKCENGVSESTNQARFLEGYGPSCANCATPFNRCIVLEAFYGKPMRIIEDAQTFCCPQWRDEDGEE